MKLFGVCSQKASNFEFENDPYPISSFTTQEYRYVKELFVRSVEILKAKERKDVADSIRDIRQLIDFYESADSFMCSLVNEVFRIGFSDGMERKQRIFEIINKLLKMFFLFDINRLRHVQVFHDYSTMNVYRHNELTPMLSVNEMLKIATFSAISMPMARLFLTYFNTDTLQIFHPVILCKRAPIHLSAEMKVTLDFVCRVVCKSNSYKYIIIFFCALYESSFDLNCFSRDIEKLKPEEQAYYRSVRNMK